MTQNGTSTYKYRQGRAAKSLTAVKKKITNNYSTLNYRASLFLTKWHSFFCHESSSMMWRILSQKCTGSAGKLWGLEHHLLVSTITYPSTHQFLHPSPHKETEIRQRHVMCDKEENCWKRSSLNWILLDFMHLNATRQLPLRIIFLSVWMQQLQTKTVQEVVKALGRMKLSECF